MRQSVSGTRDKRNSLLQTMLRKRMPDGGGAFSHSRMSGWRSRANTSRIALTSICSSIAAASKAASSRSEEHTSELKSLMRNSYADFCLKKKKQQTTKEIIRQANERSSRRTENK